MLPLYALVKPVQNEVKQLSPAAEEPHYPFGHTPNFRPALWRVGRSRSPARVERAVAISHQATCLPIGPDRQQIAENFGDYPDSRELRLVSR